MVLPVKLSSGDDTQIAHTLDITRGGARLGGLRTHLQSGETVLLQRGSKKARFRIVWIRELGHNEIQTGIVCLEPQNNLFDFQQLG